MVFPPETLLFRRYSACFLQIDLDNILAIDFLRHCLAFVDARVEDGSQQRVSKVIVHCDMLGSGVDGYDVERQRRRHIRC